MGKIKYEDGTSKANTGPIEDKTKQNPHKYLDIFNLFYSERPPIPLLSKIKSGWYIIITISECAGLKRMLMSSGKVDDLEYSFVGVFQPSIRVEPMALVPTDDQ